MSTNLQDTVTGPRRRPRLWLVLCVVLSILYPPLCFVTAGLAAWRSRGGLRVFFAVVSVLALLFSLQTGYLLGHGGHS